MKILLLCYDMFRYIQGQRRGSRILVFDHHLYTYLKETESEVQWRCRNRRCAAKLFIKPDQSVSLSIQHNHSVPHESEIQLLEFRSEIKKAARQSRDRASYIISSRLCSQSRGNFSEFPARRSLTNIV